MTTIDPDRRGALLAGRLRAIVGARWGVPDGAAVGTSAIGASLTDREGGRTWVLVDDDPARRLGMGPWPWPCAGATPTDLTSST
jgi:hypothetical protein